MTVVEMVRSKSPRLCIAIADCCNNVIWDIFSPPIHSFRYLYTGDIQHVVANYRSLFCETSGEILLAAAIPGKYAKGTMNGGVYTNALIEALSDAVHKTDSEVTWEHIVEEAYQITVQRDQTPYSELHIQSL